jgi:hypothetical protein
MEPDNTAARDFLDLWCPGGPWVLTAIDVDRKGIATHTFAKGDGKLLDKWLGNFNGVRNVYFHVNPAIKKLNKKADREDIFAVAWLHVDVDPRDGEDLKKEQKRALKILRHPPEEVPPPTCIVFSGGGYQGFWKLKDPIPVKGNLAAAEDAKLYNLQLEKLFRADHCHNIDRIMRLPGTINLPDAGKKRKGRKAALAKLIKFNDALIYPIEKFQKATAESISTIDPSKLDVPDTIKRLNSVEDLGDSVRDWCKVIIVQGSNPDDPDRYPSRSEALFAVCCELVRAGKDTSTIYNVITDPDFLISKSVRDKGKNSKKYALRQIRRAQEEAVNPWLRKLNEKHAVISSIGGRCKIIEEVYDPMLHRTRLVEQSFEDFRNRYMAQTVKVGQNKQGEPVTMQLGKWWLLQQERRQFEVIVFAPGQDPNGAYNLWRGFSCEPKEGDCSLFWGHVREHVCGGDGEIFEYVVGWMARTVQHPDSPGEAAIVMRGRMGTGKGIFANAFGSLWGRHYIQITNSKHLVGAFNAHLRDCVVLFADEAFYAGDKQHKDILKALITEERVVIEEKFKNVEQASNCTHIILASNSDWVVPAGVDDRRFLVLDIGDARIQDWKYFAAIRQQMENGGREALLYELQNKDISKFNVRDIPSTKALQDQKLLTLSSEEEWWFDKLSHGQLLGDTDYGWTERVRRDVLMNGYLTYAQRLGIHHRATSTALGKFLRRVCPKGWPKTSQGFETMEDPYTGAEKRYRPYYYAFPSLEKCRAHWDANFGGPYPWDEPEEIEEVAGETSPF